MACLLRTLGLMLFSGLLVHSQNFESRFGDVKFERSRGPGTLHNGAEVEAATGAVNLNIPLGPGIGARDIRFQPTLALRAAPRTENYLNGPSSVTRLGQGWDCSAAPGFLDLPGGTSSASANFAVSGGPRGSIISWQGVVPRSADPVKILADFGLTGVTGAFFGFGSNGELVLTLAGTGEYGSVSLPSWVGRTDGVLDVVCQNFSRRVLVVDATGDTAYEFTYVNPEYPHEVTFQDPCGGLVREAGSSQAPPTAMLAVGGDPSTTEGVNQLRLAHYLIVAIRNRFNERIDFDWAPRGVRNGVNFRATWTPYGGGSGASVEFLLESNSGPARIVPRVTAPGRNPTAFGKVRVKYQGFSQSDVLFGAYPMDAYEVISTSSPWGVSSIRHWDSFLEQLQPDSLTLVDSAETLGFDYARNGEAVVLDALRFPTSTVSFTWAPFTTSRNTENNPLFWRGFVLDTRAPAGCLDASLGVTQVQETDPVNPAYSRVTQHSRTVPVLASVDASGKPTWTSNAFSAARILPDGTTVVSRFAEPLADTLGGPEAPLHQQMQTLAHLGHVLVEERTYEPGVDYSGDLASEPATSKAFRIVRYGHGAFLATSLATDWSLLWLGNLDGTQILNKRIYPLLEERWHRDGETLVKESIQRSDWDAKGLGHRKQRTLIQLGEVDQLEVLETRDHQSLPGPWLMGRTKSLVRLRTPRSATGSAFLDLTSSQETQRWERDDDSSRLKSMSREDPSGAFLKVSYPQYTGPNPDSAVLTGGPDLNLSGEVGANYGYDDCGYRKRIQPRGRKWFSQQVQDAAGRPTTQTDPNGLSSQFQWDTCGRLTSVAAPGLLANTYSYSDDHRSIACTRGAQSSELRYNGLGQLVLERRWNAPTLVAHKAYGYDLGGRKTFESVWRAGAGTDLEGREATGTDADRWSYDGQGRLICHTDPNGLLTTTSYGDLLRTVTTAGKITTFRSDPVGRLAQVTDANLRSTQYAYDAADRILQVSQESPGIGVQLRRWSYHPLGWVASLTQPESGETAYGQFDVQGHAWEVSYLGLDSSLAARTVAYTFDPEGRLHSAKAVGDSSLDQAFTYDSASMGLGKIASDQDGAILRKFEYAEDTGLLKSLTSSVPGMPDLVQSFGYDSYGQRILAKTGDHELVTGFDAAMGVPGSLSYQGQTVATAKYWPLFRGLMTLSHTEASSSYTYDADQQRLSALQLSNRQGGATFKYVYDTGGRLTNTGEASYSYDLLDRLQSASFRRLDASLIAQTFTYDDFGNLLSVQSSANSGLTGDFLFTAGTPRLAQHNQLPETPATLASYDNQGNLTQVNTGQGGGSQACALTYDALGRVLSMFNSATNLSERYFYTAEGLRTVIEEWDGSVLRRKRINYYNDARQLVCQWVVE